MVQETAEESVTIAFSRIIQNNLLGSFSLKKVIFTIMMPFLPLKQTTVLFLTVLLYLSNDLMLHKIFFRSVM